MISTSSDRVDVWVGTQNADLALNYAAQVSGVKPVNVFIHNTFSGSGFGRRLGPDEVAQAVAVSKAIGKPVKLIWTREEEIRQGRYRTQAAIRFKAGFAADGTAIALDMRNSAGSSNPANVRNGPAMQGLVNTAYKLANFRLVSILKNTHVPLGPWRAPGPDAKVFDSASAWSAARGSPPSGRTPAPVPTGAGSRPIVISLVGSADRGGHSCR